MSAATKSGFVLYEVWLNAHPDTVEDSVSGHPDCPAAKMDESGYEEAYFTSKRAAQPLLAVLRNSTERYRFRRVTTDPKLSPKRLVFNILNGLPWIETSKVFEERGL